MMKNNASLVSMWKKKDLLVGQLILGERKYSSMKKKKNLKLLKTPKSIK